ncbi:LysM peptidoglycan-binding domain-containing protein [Caballeronia telluris]|uniref:Rhs family protein n=1 Tax=Caballeronia telluris TaxID=326475 RepID=A0A158ETD2_9BURK|nr:LysM peptidoglycan-binding domain-containing protein [Caballeronia telluris]SAL10824.1 Rhs family protein [Caballeronia telluris]
MVAIFTGNGLGTHSSLAFGLGKRGQVGDAAFGQTGEQIFVNAANGNLLVEDRDQMLLGRGDEGAVYRAYNSLGAVPDDSWRPGGVRTVNGLGGVLNTAGSTVLLTDWDGSSTSYTYDVARKVYVSTASYADVAPAPNAGPATVTTPGARATLSFDLATQSWLWRDGANQLTQTFDAAHDGRLVSSSDRDGNAVSYAYNAQGQLTRVTTAGGDVSYLDYNASGQLTGLRAEYRQPGGGVVTATTTRYVYDAKGRLSEVNVDLSPLDGSIADGNVFKTTYAYDGASSRIASISQSDGSRVAFTYQLVGSDYRVATIAQTGDGGATRVTSLSYDTATRTTTVTDPLGSQQLLTYDAAGRLTKIATSGSGDTHSQSFTYDARGNVQQINDSELGSVRLVYDSAGNLIQQTGGGSELLRTYGASNELLTERVSGSSPTTTTGNQTVRYAYDGLGHLRYSVSGEGRVTEYRYNAQGQRITEIRYAGGVFDVSSLGADAPVPMSALDAWVAGLGDRSDAVRIDTTWDYRSQIASETRYERLKADGSGDTAAGIVQTRYIYDAFGRLLQHFVGAPGQETVEQFTYDGLGRLLSATSFDGVVTLYQYDDAKHTVAVTFGNGLTRTSAYDAAGELVSVSDSVQGKLLSRITNAYDSDGRLRMSTDAGGKATQYLYNGRGQRVAMISADGTLTEYKFDALAGYQNATVTYATRLSNAQLSTLADGSGRPVERLPSGAALTLDSSGLRPQASTSDRAEWLVRDSNGQVIGTIDSDRHAIKYDYDTRGNLIKTTKFSNLVDASKLSGASVKSDSFPVADVSRDRVKDYYYDRDGLLRGEIDPEGSITEYRYNAAGERTETVRYFTQIDAATRLSGLDFAKPIPYAPARDESERFVYDARGLLSAQIDAEGYVTRYRYDARGNVIERVRGERIDPGMLSQPQMVPMTFTATGQTGAPLEIWIDGLRQASLTLTSPSGSYSVMVLNQIPLASHTIEFRSVSANPVKVGTASFGERAFTGEVADSIAIGGNPPMTGVRYAASAASLLSSVMTGAQTERTTYAYDAMGRVLERSMYEVTGSRTTRYSYDSQGNLTSQTENGRTQTNRYDAQGRLTGQLTGEGSAALAALGANPAQAQIDSVWSTWGVRYTYDPAGLRTAMTDANGNVTRYYYDTAGRLAVIVNALGEVTQYGFDAFGDRTQTTVYATRVAANVLSTLTGGTLSDALTQTFSALGDDGKASRTSLSYSTTGRVLRRTDALGARTDFAYNAFGEITSETRDLSAGARVTMSFTYDRMGRQVQQISDLRGLNVFTNAVYDAFGRLVQTVDANGTRRYTDYDRNGNVVVVTDATGAETSMTYDAFGNVLTRTDRTGKTTQYAYSAASRQMSVTTPEGIVTVTTYNESGQVVGIKDGRGNTTNYAYDLDGNLIQTQNPVATTGQAFDHAGQLIRMTDARGVQTTFSYDAAGRTLTRTVDPGGLALVTRYEYDAKGAVVRTTDPSGLVTETQYDLDGRSVSVIADPLGLRLRTDFAYDSAGRVVTVTEGAGTAAARITQKTYDNLDHLLSSVVDPTGLKLKTQYAYDANGNVVAVTDAAGGVTRYVYDQEGRQIWSLDPTGAAVQSGYDAEGRLISQQRFDARISLSGMSLATSAAQIAARIAPSVQRDELTRYAYDADGRLRFSVDALGYVTEQVYDANGNVVSRIAYATPVSLSGLPDAAALANTLRAQTSAMHASDRITRTVYDAANRAAFSIDAQGYVTQNRFDAQGHLTGQTTYALAWNGGGNPSVNDLTQWLASPGVVRAAQDRTTNWIFDNAGRPVYIVDPEGYVTANRYDAAGHVAQSIRYAGRYDTVRTASPLQAAALLPSTAPADAVVTQYRYDSGGRLIEVVNGMGVVTHYTLDSLGRAVETVLAYGTAQPSATHSVFDAAGNLIEQTRAWGSPAASTTRYAYDGLGRQVAHIDPRGVELSGQDTQWALSERKALGFVDGSGNALTVAALTDGQRQSLLARYTNTQTYDAAGHLTAATNALGYTTRYQYDAFGNRVTTTDPSSATTVYFYDGLNRLVTQVSPDNSVVSTRYDAFGDPVQVTHYAQFRAGAADEAWKRDGWRANPALVLPPADSRDAVTTLEYDRAGRLVRSTDAEGYAETYGYDAFGNRTSHANKLGGVFTYTYDRRGLKLSETLPAMNSKNVPVVNLYAYDSRGNCVTVTEASRSDSVSPSEERVTYYAYDLLDRVVSKTGVANYTNNYVTPVERYAYDARGNQVSRTDATGNKTTWYFDAANQRTGEVNALGTLTLWAFDAAGNVNSTRVYADPVSAVGGSQPPIPKNAANVRETRSVYDANGRIIESRVMNVATGYFDPTAGEDQRGAYFLTSGSELVTRWEYDGRGLLVAKTDPSGYRSLYFYNGNGQKTLEIDPKGYGIAYTLDAQGNVTRESHFAQAYPDPVTAGSSLAATLVDTWPRSGDDRITEYTWDRNGRKTSETRLNVQYANVDSNGKLQQLTGNATSRYAYDGEGHLLRRIDANGSQYDFTYDALGRQTSQKLPQFADHQGRLVRTTTNFKYDGLNRVVEEDVQAGDGTLAHTYLYNYWYGYALLYVTDLQGYGSTSFGYDAAGNTTSISTYCTDADGNGWDFVTNMGYDALNREVSRSTFSRAWSDASFGTNGKQIERSYNAYGELTARRTNGGGPGGAWQEYSDYDNAGRVVRTNFDDGISHLFVYDRNGNATLKVESMNADLRGKKIDTGEDLKALLQSVDMMQTFTRYDERNQVIQIRQPKTSGGVPYIHFSPVDIPIDGGQFANTQLSISGWTDAANRPVTGPTLPVEGGDIFTNNAEDLAVTTTVSWKTDSNPAGLAGIGISALEIDLPDLRGIYGAYEVNAVVHYSYDVKWVTFSGDDDNLMGNQQSIGEDVPYYTPPVTATSISPGRLDIPLHVIWGDVTSFNFSYRVELTFIPRSGQGTPITQTIAKTAQLLGTNVKPDALDTSVRLDGIAGSNSITVALNSLAHAESMLYYRPAGSTENFKSLPKSADSQSNSYTADVTDLPDGDYEMIFMAVSDGGNGPAGTLLRRDGYSAHISRSGGSSVTHVDIPQHAPSDLAGFKVDASGSYLWSAPQVLNLYSPRSSQMQLADHLVVHLRKPNDAGWKVDVPVYRNAATGAFTLDLSGYGADNYNIAIDLCDASGATLDSLLGTVALTGGNGTPSLSLGYQADFKSMVVFHSQPASTDYMVVSWVQGGATKYATLHNTGGDFIWDTSQYGLPANSTCSIKFTSYDYAGMPLSMGQGDVTIGRNAQATLTGSARASILQFTPTDNQGNALGNVDTLTLMYRQSTQKDNAYDRPFTTITLHKDAAGRFLFDAGSLPTNVEYEYRYWAKDAAGNVLMERQSYFLTGTRNNPVTNVDIVGVIDELSKDMTIDRLQHHNAFEEVSGERDGRGNWTYSSYNTMGMLVLKQQPTVSVTLTNGAKIETTPLTHFYYDLTGNLVGLLDANGHLSTQQYNYGTASPSVAKSWDALGYSKAYQYDGYGNLRVSSDELGRRTDYKYDARNRLTEVDRPVLADGQRSIDRYEYDELDRRIAHTNALGGREKTFYDAAGRIVRTVSAAGRAVQYDYKWASGIASIGTSLSGGWIKTTTDANGRTMADEQDLYGRVGKHTDLGGHVYRYTYNWAGLVTKQTSTAGQDVDYTYYSHGLVRSMVDNATKTQSLYEYDGDGNRTAEYFTNFGDSYVFAQSRVEYDALNRVVSISDNSYQVSYEYDAVGNRRRMVASYTDMVGYHQKTQDYWYEYDALNRFTVSMGTLSGERASDPNDTSVHIVAGPAGGEGVQLGYDAAGERVLAVYAKDGRTERYTYDANGYLQTQTINGVVAQERANDLLGRVSTQLERDVKTGKVVSNVTRTWDADSLQSSERDALNGLSTSYTRLADGTLVQIDSKPDDANGTRTVSTYTYEWWEGAKQSKVVVQPSNPNAPGWKAATTYYNYDANGNLKSTYDDGGGDASKARAFQYWTDLRGQVQRRDELTGVRVDANGRITGAAGDRKHNYYYLNGNRVGNQGNDGIDSIDYVQELSGKLTRGGNESQYKVFTPIGTADFDENFMAIDGTYPGVSPGTWTVRDGDTLQSIASALWGDATLWYLLADANGLQGTDVLKAGQTLSVPNKVTNVHNTASTFKPYDPGRAIGDTQPTLPDPPPPPGRGGDGCGTFVQVIAIVVAVVVTVYTAGAAAELLGAAAGGLAGGGAAAGGVAAGGVAAGGVAAGGVAAGSAATLSGAWAAGVAAISGGLTGGIAGAASGTIAVAAGAAAGSLASQAVLVAGGQQRGLDWKGMAISAASAAVGAGVTGSLSSVSASALGGGAGAAVTGAVRAAAGEGLGIALGAQHGFDWRGVAAGAIANGIGYGTDQTALGGTALGTGASTAVSGVASTLVRGGSLERNIGSIAGDTIGALVTQQMASQSVAKPDTEVANQGRYADAVYDQLMDAFGNASTPDTYTTPDMRFAGPGAPSREFLLPPIHVTPETSWVDYVASPGQAGDFAFGAGYDSAFTGTAVRTEFDLNESAFRGAMMGEQSTPDLSVGETTQQAFMRGMTGGYAGVLDPSPSAAYAGKIVYDAGQSLGQFAYQLIGAQSATEARAEWNGGNYGFAVAKEVQAFGEAGLALMGAGAGRIAMQKAIAPVSIASLGSSAGADIVGQSGGSIGSRFPRTEGLGTHTTLDELRATGALPGEQGVVVTDRTVRFGDLYKLGTLGGRQVEFSLVTERLDSALVKKLYSGDAWTSPVPRDARLIGHVHPNENSLQMWPSTQDMNMVNARYFRELIVNPNAAPAPTRVFWGPGNVDNTIFYPGFGKTPLPR